MIPSEESSIGSDSSPKRKMSGSFFAVGVSILIMSLCQFLSFDGKKIINTYSSSYSEIRELDDIDVVTKKRDRELNDIDVVTKKHDDDEDVLLRENDDGDDDTKKQIVIIGAGHGTTGTHLFYDATCRLGLTSVHWTSKCYSQNMESAIRKSFTNFTSDTVKKMNITSFQADKTLRTVFMKAFYCLRREKESCGNALEWKNQILNLMDQIAQDGQIQAFHDTPYPSLIPPLIDALRRYNKKPIFLLSERNPDDYAPRRTNHEYGGDPICIDPPPIANVSDPSLRGGGLDIIGCIDYMLAKAHPRKDLDIVDVLVSSRTLAKENFTKGVHAFATEMKTYQDKLRRHAAFSFNMFEQEERMDVGAFASLLKERIPVLQSFKELPPAKNAKLVKKKKKSKQSKWKHQKSMDVDDGDDEEGSPSEDDQSPGVLQGGDASVNEV